MFEEGNPTKTAGRLIRGGGDLYMRDTWGLSEVHLQDVKTVGTKNREFHKTLRFSTRGDGGQRTGIDKRVEH